MSKNARKKIITMLRFGDDFVFCGRKDAKLGIY